MENVQKTIHEFDMNLIREYFSSMERQGPGSPEITLKALSFVENLTAGSRVADIGCGTGGQTMVLGQNISGHITGLDLFPDYIDLFNSQAKKLKLHDRVKGIAGSMDKLPFEKEGLDLIWSEGAIYNIGFQRGLQEWREFLKPGAYVAVTEASWFTSKRPSEINDFWMEAYDEIDTIPNKVAQMQDAGYVPVATFFLPEKCWFDFYALQQAAQKSFLEKHAGNKAAEGFIEYERYEEKLYNKYKAYYGYVFFIGRKL